MSTGAEEAQHEHSCLKFAAVLGKEKALSAHSFLLPIH